VKQIIGGELKDNEIPPENFVSTHSAAWYASMYRRDKLTGGHIIKLGNGNDQAAEEALKTWPGGLQLGGGITADNALYWLDKGASALIVTSWLFINNKISMNRLAKISKKINPARLVIDLSARYRDGKYYVVTDRWQVFSTEILDEKLLRKLSPFCYEFLIHGVDVEGRRCGCDNRLIRLLAEQSPIPCVYAGGICNSQDLTILEECGAGKLDFTVGSSLDLFGGDGLKYIELVKNYS
jgi:phosphoribosylformimino-5-aminoimidazole carboxamide ribotide isomerase